jgi:hypothetical protein
LPNCHDDDDVEYDDDIEYDDVDHSAGGDAAGDDGA